MLSPDTAPPPRGPSIWAIGGGKGGVGKSLIAVALGVELAHRQQRVALVDADLGGANLHTLLGVPNPPHTLSDFLARRMSNLDEVLAPTGVENLALLSGSRALLEMANPHYAQKEKLRRHVADLSVDRVILDLGAGSAFNVLDFFVGADLGILVVVPEATSIENAYHFLKAAFFRRLKRAQPRARVKAALGRVTEARAVRSLRSPRDLIARVEELDPEAGRALRHEADGFQAAILVNRASNQTDAELGKKIAAASSEYFGSTVRSVGSLPSDHAVPASVRRRSPVGLTAPAAAFSRAVRRLVDSLEESEENVDGSAD